LSAHKKLVAEKLLEEETEHKANGEAKKEKQLVCTWNKLMFVFHLFLVCQRKGKYLFSFLLFNVK